VAAKVVAPAGEATGAATRVAKAVVAAKGIAGSGEATGAAAVVVATLAVMEVVLELEMPAVAMGKEELRLGVTAVMKVMA